MGLDNAISINGDACGAISFAGGIDGGWKNFLKNIKLQWRPDHAHRSSGRALCPRKQIPQIDRSAHLLFSA